MIEVLQSEAPLSPRKSRFKLLSDRFVSFIHNLNHAARHANTLSASASFKRHRSRSKCTDPKELKSAKVVKEDSEQICVTNPTSLKKQSRVSRDEFADFLVHKLEDDYIFWIDDSTLVQSQEVPKLAPEVVPETPEDDFESCIDNTSLLLFSENFMSSGSIIADSLTLLGLNTHPLDPTDNKLAVSDQSLEKELPFYSAQALEPGAFEVCDDLSHAFDDDSFEVERNIGADANIDIDANGSDDERSDVALMTPPFSFESDDDECSLVRWKEKKPRGKCDDDVLIVRTKRREDPDDSPSPTKNTSSETEHESKVVQAMPAVPEDAEVDIAGPIIENKLMVKRKPKRSLLQKRKLSRLKHSQRKKKKNRR